MWLSKQLVDDQKTTVDIQLADVTISETGELAASGNMEKRDIIIYAPYGIEAVPPDGSNIIAIDYERARICIGVKSGNFAIAPGEVRISSKGGAYIYLKNDGSVDINGYVFTSKATVKDTI